MDDWLKKYAEVIDAAGDSVFQLGPDGQIPAKAGDYLLVIADYGAWRLDNVDVFEVAQQLRHCIAPNGHLIVRLKSNRDPKYHEMGKVASDSSSVVDRRGKLDHYFDEVQIEEFFGPFFRVDNLCEELLDEHEHDRFVYVGCFERI